MRRCWQVTRAVTSAIGIFREQFDNPKFEQVIMYRLIIGLALTSGCYNAQNAIALEVGENCKDSYVAYSSARKEKLQEPVKWRLWMDAADRIRSGTQVNYTDDEFAAMCSDEVANYRQLKAARFRQLLDLANKLMNHCSEEVKLHRANQLDIPPELFGLDLLLSDSSQEIPMLKNSVERSVSAKPEPCLASGR